MLKRLSLSVCIAMQAVMAVVAVAVSVCTHVVQGIARLGAYAFEGALSALAPAEPARMRPAVMLLAAKQFLLRMVKREVPTVQARWRMCPSI